MSGTCTICRHEYVKRINELLAIGKPQTEIAQIYGVTQPAISRHKNNCVKKAVEIAHERGLVKGGISFVDRIRWNIEQTILLYERNGQVDDKTALAALKEIREACKDEANGPNPAQVTIIADMGFRDMAQAKEAAELMKSMGQSDEHSSVSRMVEYLAKDYLERNPDRRLEIVGKLSGRVSEG